MIGGYRAAKEVFLTVSSTVWIQYTNMTDRRTDTGRQQRPRLRVASGGKDLITHTTSTVQLQLNIGLYTVFHKNDLALNCP